MSLQDAIGIAKELVHISHVVAAEQHRVESLDRRPVVRYRSKSPVSFLFLV